MAEHYQFAVIPARVRLEDKLKVEVGVQIVQSFNTRCCATYFSLAEANAAILERLEPVRKVPVGGDIVFSHKILLRGCNSSPDS